MLTQLRLQRLLRNRKAIEVARRAGISATLLSRIERGQIRATPHVRRRLRRLLAEHGITADALIPATPETPPTQNPNASQPLPPAITAPTIVPNAGHPSEIPPVELLDGAM